MEDGFVVVDIVDIVEEKEKEEHERHKYLLLHDNERTSAALSISNFEPQNLKPTSYSYSYSFSYL